ncbi:hypothetical protein GCM10027174_44630 [Salinifilum aidingensis]
MRRALLATAAVGLAALVLVGCEQPPPDSAPQFEVPEVDVPDPAPADGENPVVPIVPDTPGVAPEPAPGRVTAVCDGTTVLDYKPHDPMAYPDAQRICSELAGSPQR